MTVSPDESKTSHPTRLGSDDSAAAHRASRPDSITAAVPAPRRIGNSELRVAPVALGGNVFGWSVDDHQARKLLDAFADGGGNLIDTADSYAAGRSETMIGSWLAQRSDRDDQVISTKIGKSANHPGLSAGAVVAAVQDSLTRLRRDRIDLLFLHIDDPTVEFQETLIAVDRLVREGSVRYVGAADHTGDRLVEARVASGLLGVAQLVALQNEYSLMHRSRYETDLAHVASSQGLGVLPRFPLAAGYLTGKYRSRADIVTSRRAGEVSPHFGRRGQRVVAALEAIARDHDVTAATIAIAWLLTKPNVVAPIASATSTQQVAALLKAPEVHLSRAQVAQLDRVSNGS